MEALNFLRFWKATTVTNTNPVINMIPDPIVVIDYFSDEEEEDDEVEEEEESYFELQITSPDFDNKENTNTNNTNTISVPEKQVPKNSVKRVAEEKPKILLQPLSIPPNEFLLSKRKILPIESPSKPQSPIALLRSAPSFRVFNFKKAKSMPAETTTTQKKTEENRGKQRRTTSLSVKFKLEDETISPKLTRGNSKRSVFEKQRGNGSSFDHDDASNSKRFSKKYLNLLKPFYEKVSKKQNKFNEDVSPAMSPAKGEKRGMMKLSSKFRSSPAVVGPPSPAMRRRDESLLQELDGIQGAILHCKRSFNATTDFEMDSSRKSAEEESRECGRA